MSGRTLQLRAAHDDRLDVSSSVTKLRPNKTPVVVSLPFSTDIESIAINLKGKTPRYVELFGGSLLNAISSIPLGAFKLFPQLSSLAMKSEVKAIATLLTKKKNTEALVALSVLKAEIALEVKTYTPTSGGYSRDQVVPMTNALIESTNKRIKAGKW